MNHEWTRMDTNDEATARRSRKHSLSSIGGRRVGERRCIVDCPSPPACAAAVAAGRRSSPHAFVAGRGRKSVSENRQRHKVFSLRSLRCSAAKIRAEKFRVREIAGPSQAAGAAQSLAIAASSVPRLHDCYSLATVALRVHFCVCCARKLKAEIPAGR